MTQVPASHGVFRLPQGGRIARAQPLRIRVDGRDLHGLAGDTVAATLLAHGVRTVGRSFKYHRPRGILAAGVEEPNALLTVGEGARREPDIAATVLEVEEGLVARTQNAWPSVRWDLMALNGLFAPLLAAGFYYKTFMGPTRGAWRFYERFIRRAAGLGRASELPDPDRYDTHHVHCEVLVVGSGAAGLTAALGAAQAGLEVLLVEQDFEPGGALLDHAVDGAQAAWLAQMLLRLQDTGRMRLLTRATAFGLYDGNTVGVIERTAPGLADPQAGVPRQRLHLVRAGSIVMAAGALERPLVFAGNDTPGVMLAGAAGRYLHRHAVLAGRSAVVAANNDAAYGSAIALARAGAQVRLLDLRGEAPPALAAQARAAGVELRPGWAVVQAQGGRQLRGCLLAPYDAGNGRVLLAGSEAVDADLLAMSGGWTPSVHLSAHRGIRPVFSEAIGSFVPGGFDRGHFGAGAMVGAQTLPEAIASGWQAAQGAVAACGGTLACACPPPPDAPDASLAGGIVAPIEGGKGRAFVDFQLDVTVDDVALAHREGYAAVEHLKRYTTLGMGTDQGKTANLQALALLAAHRGIAPQEAGTTTFRPPWTPAPVGALAGRGVRARLAPVRRTALHGWHVAQGAAMGAAGPWTLPQWYAAHGVDAASACRAEMRIVRTQVGIADLGALGRITVQGPDAAGFLDRVFANDVADLPVGRARHGFLLREDGIVLGDAVASRTGATEFFVTTAAAQAERVLCHFEFLLQVVWPALRVAVAAVTDQWAAMCVAGPRARELLQAALAPLDFGDAALGHLGPLGVLDATAGVPLRILRLGAVGELSYELHAPAHHGLAVWEHLMAVGRAWNLRPCGQLALDALRTEAGRAGAAEMDGRTTLDDLGAGHRASTRKPFWGGALREREELRRPGRPTLVGLQAVDADEPPNSGAILFFANEPVQGHGRGHVSAVAWSTLGEQAIALGLLEGGLAHLGQEVVAASPVHGRQYRLRVVQPCFLDPARRLAAAEAPASAVRGTEGTSAERAAVADSPLHGPFAGHAPFERAAPGGGIGVRITAGLPASLVQIATWPAGIGALEAALAQALRITVPTRTGAAAAWEDALLLRTGPEAFLLLGASAAPRWPALREAVADDVGAVTDLGHARGRIRIGGACARAVLSKLYALDLREAAFPTGEMRLTGHRQVPCLLLRRGADDFDILVPTSHAHDHLGTVIDAALEYGVALEMEAGLQPASTSTRQS